MDGYIGISALVTSFSIKTGKKVILSDLEYAKSLADERSHEIRTVTFFLLLEALKFTNVVTIGDS
jgi:hypothetical protein